MTVSNRLVDASQYFLRYDTNHRGEKVQWSWGEKAEVATKRAQLEIQSIKSLLSKATPPQQYVVGYRLLILFLFIIIFLIVIFFR